MSFLTRRHLAFLILATLFRPPQGTDRENGRLDRLKDCA